MVVVQDFYSAMSDDSYLDLPYAFTDCPIKTEHADLTLFQNLFLSRVARMVFLLLGSCFALYVSSLISLSSFLVLSISILFTWSHIWLALKMCFYPLEFVGIELFGHRIGWQGIVPRKAHKMASKSCDLMINKLIIVNDLIDRISGVDLVCYLRRIKCLDQLENRINERLQRSSRLFQIFQDDIHNLTDSICIQFVDELKVLLMNPEFFNLRKLIVSEFVSDKRLLVHLFTQVGCRELEFIQLAGACMGLFCGVFQLALYQYIESSTVVIFSLSGMLIGLITNWLALYVIFNPIVPIHIVFPGGYIWVIHGLFLSRQAEASAKYASIVADSLLNVPRCIDFLKEEGKWDSIKTLFQKNLEIRVYQQVPSIIPNRVKENLLIEILAELELSSHLVSEGVIFFLSDRLKLKETIGSKLASLPSDQFEQMLHPVFQEDESLLILIGAVLGAVVGTIQSFTM